MVFHFEIIKYIQFLQENFETSDANPTLSPNFNEIFER